MRRAQSHLSPLISILLLCSALSYGQAWSGILAPARAVDWTKAGIPGGIPSGTWANCVTTQCNTVNGGTVTQSSINAALSSAPNNTVVRIPAGTFSISGDIFTNRSNVAMRGAGPTQTTLNMSGNIFFGATGSGGLGGEPGLSASNWTGGLTKGSTVITLASTSGLAAGQQIGLDQLNDTSLVFTQGSDGTLSGVNRNGTQNFDGNNSRAQFQLAEIKAVCTGNNTPAGFGCTAANQLAIDPPVDYTHQSGLTPQAFWWSPRNVQYVGIENVRVNANSHDFAVNFSFASYFWTKNIEVRNAARSAVHTYYGFRGEIRDSYISGPNSEGGPTQYGFEIVQSTLIKLENNIIFGITSGVLPDTSTGIVVDYNYALNTASGNQFGDFEPHAVHNYYHLYEGNVVDRITVDNVWGSHSQTTLFRNRSSGKGQNKLNFRGALSISAHNRYMNLIGNVFGTTGFHTRYQVDDTNQNGSDTFIMELGFFNRWDFNQTPYDSVVKTSLMRWGNWDSVNNASRFLSSEVPTTDPTFPNFVPASQTLPASFMYSTKPAWFGDVIWPPIGPDVTCSTNCISNAANHAAKIPAQLCYENTAKSNGYLTAFDADACYAAVSGGPQPPSGLAAAVN
jgi:hypothetical protein